VNDGALPGKIGRAGLKPGTYIGEEGGPFDGLPSPLGGRLAGLKSRGFRLRTSCRTVCRKAQREEAARDRASSHRFPARLHP
jgi:hypothetical protein